MTGGSTARVGLVFVSHSSQLAAGAVALAGQMAPSVTLLPAGGTDDDGIGTSFGKVMTAVGEADQGSGVVVVSDLGSALLTAETVLDMLPEDERARVRVVDGPFVEGGVAAAVAAETGADLAGSRPRWKARDRRGPTRRRRRSPSLSLPSRPRRPKRRPPCAARTGTRARCSCATRRACMPGLPPSSSSWPIRSR
ncbi:dihydroxyacetone kinase phosphoryl donor subunit DhaM [Streptomyces sp. L7]|uniref:dihydroxyacetone kinase phosphoryl donor subunit DhaM n=1 Tax=Streptomyces sp. L7 TaxID=3423954 RepID=UPI003D9576FB